MGRLGANPAEVIPAHWIQQVITNVIPETFKHMPTGEMNVARA